MGHVKELARRLSDPTLTWFISRAFGGWVRRQAVTTTNPQTLHVCDEIICIPTRFSENLYWQDGSGNLVSRIFPNHMEAWDHTNETNPNTSAPYDGTLKGIVGYTGYFMLVDLTDGTSKTRVYITKRTYPELQILIFNMGTLTVRVNDPPAGFGLSKYTTGTAGSGYTDIDQNQYVVFYKTTQPSVDTTNGVFAQSPLGTSKRWSNEIIGRYTWGFDIGFNLYTGIKAPKDMYGDYSLGAGFSGASYNRGGINVSGFMDGFPLLCIYDADPYCSQRSWAGDNFPYVIVTGWAEDEGGNPKFTLITNIFYKHTTKKEQRSQQIIAVLYDADLDEAFTLRVTKPVTDIYCYGQGGAVWTPNTHDTDYGGNPDASVARIVTPTDAVQEFTSPASATWTYIDAYALMQCYGSPVNDCRGAVALGIYTDDTGVSIPSDVRQVFGVCRSSDKVRTQGFQVKPFMDRTLYAGKTYAVVTRVKVFPSTATGTDLLNWAKKKYPYVISSDEWNSLLSVPPFAVALAGGLPPSGSITYSISGTPAPGQTITISGKALRANTTVWAVLIDPDTYTVIAKNSGTTDANGIFSVSLTIPTTASAGKTYRLYIIA
jgi:hypothetical protein